MPCRIMVNPSDQYSKGTVSGMLSGTLLLEAASKIEKVEERVTHDFTIFSRISLHVAIRVSSSAEDSTLA